MSKLATLTIPHHTGIRVALDDPVATAAHVVRIPVARRALTATQLTGLARLLRRHCPGESIRVHSPDQLEVTVAHSAVAEVTAAVARLEFQPRPGDAPPKREKRDRQATPVLLRLPHGALNARQLLALAALLHMEGVSTVTIGSTTRLYVDGIRRDRHPTFRLGLGEFDFTTH
jgi:hypothetical protein